MSIEVKLASQETQFPNFPNICEIIQKKATEMGIKKNIHICNCESPSLLEVYTPSNFATLQLPKNFSSISSEENPTEFLLRHELVHILYKDDLQKRHSKYLPLLTLSTGWTVGLLSFKVLNLNSSPSILNLCLSAICLKFMPLIISNYVYTRINGGSAALRFKEKRADEEACKYMSIEEKINTINFFHRKVKKEGYKYGEMYKFYPWNDNHPTIKERIQILWNTFTPEQKLQHSQFDPLNIVNVSRYNLNSIINPFLDLNKRYSSKIDKIRILINSLLEKKVMNFRYENRFHLKTKKLYK